MAEARESQDLVQELSRKEKEDFDYCVKEKGSLFVCGYSGLSELDSNKERGPV